MRTPEPFATKEAADVALNCFFAAVTSAREQFGIQNVVAIAMVSVDGIGDAQSFINSGDRWHALPMVAQAYGAILSETQSELMRLRSADGDVIRGGRGYK